MGGAGCFGRLLPGLMRGFLEKIVYDVKVKAGEIEAGCEGAGREKRQSS